MSGALRKMTNFLGYSEPAEDYDEDYRDPGAAYDSYADSAALSQEDEAEDLAAYTDLEDPAAMGGAGTGADLRRIVTVHPSTYNDAQVIGQACRDGVPVILNLTNMNEAEARRMVDFSAGLVFGLRGAIEPVTPRVFLLTPATVKTDAGQDSSAGSDRFFNQG